MGTTRTYDFDSDGQGVEAAVERRIVAPLARLGYVVDHRGKGQLTLLGLRRPRWAIALAIFLFPVGLVLLLIKRPRELTIGWQGSDPVELTVAADDYGARHVVAAVAVQHERPPRLADKAAPAFIAGLLPVSVAWVSAVQLVGSAAGFVVIVGVGAILGCGLGTLVAMRRAARAEDPLNPIRWGLLPALAGALTAIALWSALVALLLVVRG